jgi:uncharacterized protein YciI
MQFFVHGVDNVAVSEKLQVLAEQHWTYMDRHAEHLVARGPTLSPDGTTHTGSVHVIEAPTIQDARRFAFLEPYWLAGVYASVSVTGFQNALDGSMWDRPPTAAVQASTLVLTSWLANPGIEVAAEGGRTLTLIAGQEPLVFGGLLVSEDGMGTVGLVAALDVDVVEAKSVIATLALPEAATTVSYRWRRGGRHQG